MSRILLLEDDEALGRGICMALETPNCTVTHCSTRLQAIKILQGVVFDLLILDINLPDGSGLELLRTLRQNGTSTPAILLTANDLELDEVTGLEAGADDYITKPFNPVEVQARVKSQLRRYMQLGGGNMTKKNLAIGGIELDDSAKVVTLDGDAVSLTPTEYDILKLFMEQPGVVFSPKDIYRKVWKDAPFGSESTVAVHIRHLREKLEYDPANPRYLKVVWGQGYKIE